MGILSGLLSKQRTQADTLNTGLETLGGGVTLQGQAPEFVQFPQFYGISQEQLSSDPNIDPAVINSAPTLAQLNNPNDMVRWHANEKTKHQERTFIPQMALDFVRQTQPDLIPKWEAQGEKGFVESATEDPGLKLPFIGSVAQTVDELNVMEAMKRLGNDQYKDITTQPQITLAQGLSGQGIDLTSKTSTAQSQKNLDEDILGDWLLDKAENEVRGQTIGGAIGAGISEMPAFMAEFAATGPGAAIVRGAVKKGATKLTGKFASKKIASGVGKVAGFTAGATARTAQAPQQIAKGTTGGLLGDTDVDLTEDGFNISRSTTPFKELLKATGSTFIDMFSEQAGKDIIGKLIPNKVKETFEKAFKGLNPNKKVTELWTKGGFDGFAQEMGEEELAEIMRVGFGLDSFETFKENKTLRNYLIKGGIIGTVGSVGKAASFLPAPKKTIAESEKDLSGTLERKPIEPILIEDGEINEQATLDTLPPIPKGMVRMYRAESPTVSFGDIFDKETLKDFAPDREGSFWSVDLDTANFFRKKYGDDAALSFVDVPKGDATNFKVNGNNVEFVLSDEIFKEGDKPKEKEVISGPETTKDLPVETIEPKPIRPTQEKAGEEVPPVVEEVIADTERPEIAPKRKTRRKPSMSLTKVVELIDVNSKGGLRLGDIKRALAKGGDRYVLEDVLLADLNVEDRDIAGSEADKSIKSDVPIVVTNGEVIDGRHRVMAAIQRGETTIKALVPQKPEPTKYSKSTDSSGFLKELSKNKRVGFLEEKTVAELDDMELHTTDDGKSGYAIGKDGFLSSVFNNSGKKGLLSSIMPDAILNGATNLDAYEGFLSDQYAKYGFEITNTMKWDDKFAPDGWDYDLYGRPNVVEMKLNKDFKDGTSDARKDKHGGRVLRPGTSGREGIDSGDKATTEGRTGQVSDQRASGKEVGQGPDGGIKPRKTRPSDKKADAVSVKGIARISEKPKVIKPQRKTRKPITEKKAVAPKPRPVAAPPARKTRPTVKQQIRQTTGQIDDSKKRSFTETQLLKLKLNAGQKASIKAFTSGGKQSVNNIKDALEFVRKVLPPELREKAIASAANINKKDGQQSLFDTINRIIEKSKTPVKRLIRERTGQVDISKKRQVSEKSLLNLRLSSEQRGSLKGFRAAKLETKSNLKEAQDFVNSNLPLEVRGKALAALKGATDQKGLDKVISTVNKLQDEFEHRQAKEALIKSLKKVTGKKAGKLGVGAREKVERITREFSLKSTSEKVSKKLNGLMNAIKDDPLNFDDQTIQTTIDKLEGAGRTPLGDLSTQRLKDLTLVIDNIKKLDSLKDKLVFGNMARDAEEFKQKIMSSLKKQPSLKRIDKFGTPERNKLSEVLLESTLGPIETSQRIDDADNGAMKTIFYDNPKKQEDKYLKVRHGAEDLVIETASKAGVPWGEADLQKWSRHTSKKGKATIISIPLESGKELKVSRAELIGLNLMMSDPYQQKKIIDNGLVYEGFDIAGPQIKITKRDFETIKNKLTDKEKFFTEALSGWYSGEGKALLDGTLNQLGQSRKLRPNYYPITVSKNKTQEYRNLQPEQFIKDLAGSSFLQETVQHQKPIVLRDAFVQFFEHVDQTAKARHIMMPVRNMLRITGDPDIKAELTRVGGKTAVDYWNNRTRAIVQMGPSRVVSTDKIYNEILQKFGASALGWNPSPILKQAGGLWPAASIIGPKVFNNFAKAIKSNKKISAEFTSGSSALENRYRIHGAHLTTQNLRDIQPLLGKQTVSDKSLSGLQEADKMIVSAIYLTVKDKIKKNNPKLSEKDLILKASRETELVVAKTQNVTSVLDMSKLAIDSKSSAILKTTTMFKSNAERMQNMVRQSLWKYRKSDKTLADKKQFLNTTASVMIGNAGHSVVTSKLLKIALAGAIGLVTGSGTDDVEELLTPEELYISLPKELLMENLGNYYFIGDLSRMADAAFSSKFWWRTNLTGPVGDMVTTGIEAAVNTGKAAEEGFSGVRGTKMSINAAFDVAEVAFRLRGIPTYPLRVAEKGMKKLLDNTKSGSTGGRKTRTKTKVRKRKQR